MSLDTILITCSEDMMLKFWTIGLECIRSINMNYNADFIKVIDVEK